MASLSASGWRPSLKPRESKRVPWTNGYTVAEVRCICSRIAGALAETRRLDATGLIRARRPRFAVEAIRFRERYAAEPGFRILVRLRRRLRTFVRGRKSETMLSLVGCSQADLIRHIEAQFTGRMSWSNIGLWHIDHVVPCSRFDLTTEAGRRACFHFTNLQPMWAVENMRKNDIIATCQPQLLLSA